MKVPSIKRMPSYLGVVEQAAAEGRSTISAPDIARQLDLEGIVVRKDLALTGIVGKPRVGYEVKQLVAAIRGFLGWNNTSDAFVVGVGSLGAALMGYRGFDNHGLNIVAGFDVDPAKVGHTVHGKEVFHLGRMPELARRMHVHLGVLTVPEAEAQPVAEVMVEAGMLGIWNFTPVKLTVPDEVVTHQEDLSAGLAVLSKTLQDVMDPHGASS